MGRARAGLAPLLGRTERQAIGHHAHRTMGYLRELSAESRRDRGDLSEPYPPCKPDMRAFGRGAVGKKPPHGRVGRLPAKGLPPQPLSTPWLLIIPKTQNGDAVLLILATMTLSTQARNLTFPHSPLPTHTAVLYACQPMPPASPRDGAGGRVSWPLRSRKVRNARSLWSRAIFLKGSAWVQSSRDRRPCEPERVNSGEVLWPSWGTVASAKSYQMPQPFARWGPPSPTGCCNGEGMPRGRARV